MLAQRQLGVRQGAACLPVRGIGGHVAPQQLDRLGRGNPLQLGLDSHRQHGRPVRRRRPIVDLPQDDVRVVPAILGGIEREQLLAGIVEDGRIRRMQRVGIDDRQQGRLSVPGPVHQQIGLPLAVERLGLSGATRMGPDEAPGYNPRGLRAPPAPAPASSAPRRRAGCAAGAPAAPSWRGRIARFPIQVSIVRRSATGRVSRQYHQAVKRDPAEDQTRPQERPGSGRRGSPCGDDPARGSLGRRVRRVRHGHAARRRRDR